MRWSDNVKRVRDKHTRTLSDKFPGTRVLGKSNQCYRTRLCGYGRGHDSVTDFCESLGFLKAGNSINGLVGFSSKVLGFVVKNTVFSEETYIRTKITG
jgi:hypothetical protein